MYSAYAGAPEQFRNFSQEILSLHVVVKTVEDQLRNRGPRNNTLTLSAKHTDDLKTLHDGLQTIIKELDALLKKYQSLTEDRFISFDRLKWGQEDLVGLRERILMHVGLLTAFNTSITWYVHVRLPFRFLIMTLYYNYHLLPALVRYLQSEVLSIMEALFQHIANLCHCNCQIQWSCCKPECPTQRAECQPRAAHCTARRHPGTARVDIYWCWPPP